jgi:hypothetical protein
MAPVGARYTMPATGSRTVMAAGGHLGLGQSRALMIVGAAGILVGAIAGGQTGTVLIAGGAVIGLIGLYEYVQ